jgi:hypothetical protein
MFNQLPLKRIVPDFSALGTRPLQTFLHVKLGNHPLGQILRSPLGDDNLLRVVAEFLKSDAVPNCFSEII